MKPGNHPIGVWCQFLQDSILEDEGEKIVDPLVKEGFLISFKVF